MTLYCLVENGQIVEGPRDLPRAWRNVSGLKPESAAEHGWLPLEEGAKPAFDPRSQALDRALAVKGDKVDAVYMVRPATAEEIAATVPGSVDRYQIRAALKEMGRLEAARSAVQAASEDLQLAFNEANAFRRTSPTIAALAAALGLTAAQVDELFRLAATKSA